MSEETNQLTNVSEVYDSFLSKIENFKYISDDVTIEEILSDLFGFFKSAKAHFPECRNSLKLDDNGFFNSTLTDYEIEILVKYMMVEYITPHVMSDGVILQSLSDKDFKIHSQASQLRELSLLYRQLQKEAEKMKTKYTYMEMFNNDK